MVELDGQLRQTILKQSDMEALEATLESRGHMNLIQDGRRLVNQGITTNAEIERVCGV
jgi:type II secretory ATPase GspE/PulE/Tfp pilus assembly ATPase PilB-like protein